MPDDLLTRHPDASDASVSTASEPATASVPALPVETLTQVAGTAARSRSESTRRNYAADWTRFTAWCQREGHSPLPAHPLTVAAYLHDAAATVTEAGERAYSPSTLARWVAGIGFHHRRAGHPAPGADELVTATLSGIRRDYAAAGERPRTPRAPLLTADIVTIVDTARARCEGWADEVLERRDSAIFLLGFAGAFRRSELVALTCSDVSLHRLDGLHIRLRKTKTDQEGRGSIRALPFTHSHTSCPPCAWMRWAQVVAAFDTGGRPAVIRLLRSAEPFETHVCRGSRPRMVPSSPWLRSIRKNGNLSETALSGAAVHKAIRRRAAEAGYDPEIVQQLGGHYRDRAVVWAMLFGGLRSAEVRSLRLADVDFGRRRVRVLGKGCKERVVPVDAAFFTELSAYLRLERPPGLTTQECFVVLRGPTVEAPITEAGLRSLFRRHRELSGAGRVRPHRLRHTYGTELASAGIDLMVLRELMGHVSPETTAGYVHLSVEQLAAEYGAARASLAGTRR